MTASTEADGNEIYYRSGPRLMAGRLEKTASVKVVATHAMVTLL